MMACYRCSDSQLPAQLVWILSQQIELGVAGAEEDVAGLTREWLGALDIARRELKSSTDPRVLDAADRLQEVALSSVARLQFMDRLKQQMQNVASNLALLADADDRVIDTAALLDTLRAAYTTQNERDDFERLLERTND